jgi:hypothetical protein
MVDPAGFCRHTGYFKCGCAGFLLTRQANSATKAGNKEKEKITKATKVCGARF